MKLFMLIIGFLLGLVYPIIKDRIGYQYETYIQLNHKPKFKVGECILTYKSFTARILEITKTNEYGYTVGAECKSMFDCSTSMAPSSIIDTNSELMECPE